MQTIQEGNWMTLESTQLVLNNAHQYFDVAAGRWTGPWGSGSLPEETRIRRWASPALSRWTWPPARPSGWETLGERWSSSSGCCHASGTGRRHNCREEHRLNVYAFSKSMQLFLHATKPNSVWFWLSEYEKIMIL